MRPSTQATESAAQYRGAGVVEEKVPRIVEIKPALAAEPARRQAGDVQERVAAHAHHLHAIPTEEGTRSDADLGGMDHTAQADGASLALIR